MEIPGGDPSRDKMQVKTIADALKVCRQSLVAAFAFSAVINLLMLVPPMYMIQMFDRVLSSGSISTLGFLTAIMAYLIGIMGVLEWVRSQILIKVSSRFDKLLSGRLYSVSMEQALYTGGRNAQGQPLQDLLGLRQFLTGTGLFAFFDAPWLPIYIAVMFIIHPVYGLVAVFASCLLVIIAVWNEKTTGPLLALANKDQIAATAKATKRLRNAEVIHAMGMHQAFRNQFIDQHNDVLLNQSAASEKAGFFVALSKTLRIFQQSLILGTGAYLAVNQEVTPGLMIAGSVLLGRALQPVDQIIGVWKQFAAARLQYSRLSEILEEAPLGENPMALPDPAGKVTFEQVVVVPPGARAPVTQIGSLELKSGITAVIGPSAAGKSTLVRALLGIWPLAKGVVRLDGADLHRWDREHVGRFIGYLPQDIELFEGSVAENISRFGGVDSEAVIDAAKVAGVHDMILSLPQGYDTDLTTYQLSAGQRQRVALARAVYGSPCLIVLDEPNSNLDEVGEASLATALVRLKESGANVLIVSHRKSILEVVDHIMVLAEGKVKMMGPRDNVLAKLSPKAANVTMMPASTNNKQ